jgi:hypothetical protein
MNGHTPQGDATQERMKASLPKMQENLVNLEMRHSWLLEEAKKLSKVIENQRGAIALAQELTAAGASAMPTNGNGVPTAPNGSEVLPVTRPPFPVGENGVREGEAA